MQTEAPVVSHEDLVFQNPWNFEEKEENTRPSLQELVDQAAAAGGGRVVVPPGDHFSAPIELKSHVELHLTAGARLLAQTGWENYLDQRDRRGPYVYRQFFRSFIYARGQRNIRISGAGEINGQGHLFDGTISSEGTPPRPKLLWLDDCEDVQVDGIRLCDSAAWVFHLSLCRDVVVRGVTILSETNVNNDGLDIDSCTDVRISDCRIDTEDDAIVLKTMHNQPCRNVTVTNCQLRSRCYAFKLGTDGMANYENVLLSNTVIHDTDRVGIGIVLADGAGARRVRVENVIMDNVNLPVFIHQEVRNRIYTDEVPVPQPGPFEQISFSGLTINMVPGPLALINGLPERPLEAVTFRDLDINDRGDPPARVRSEKNCKARGRKAEGETYKSPPSWGKDGLWPQYVTSRKSALPEHLPQALFVVVDAQEPHTDNLRLHGSLSEINRVAQFQTIS